MYSVTQPRKRTLDPVGIVGRAERKVSVDGRGPLLMVPMVNNRSIKTERPSFCQSTPPKHHRDYVTEEVGFGGYSLRSVVHQASLKGS